MLTKKCISVIQQLVIIIRKQLDEQNIAIFLQNLNKTADKSILQLCKFCDS